MFQIPDDDDDEFWNEIPLDIGQQGQYSNVGKENRPQLRIPQAVPGEITSEKTCSDINSGRSAPIPGTDSVQKTCYNHQNFSNTSNQQPTELPAPVSTFSNKNVSNPVINKSNSVGSISNHERDRSNKCDRVRSRSGDSNGNDYITPKRRRKFPGPAGILPKLGPGRSIDALSPSILNPTSPDVGRSTEDDSVVTSSQTADDLFNDSAWQALMSDLGDDGQKLLKKFSITTTLNKASKKQLYQGKASLIFGIIESVESHGSEASVNIRDKSGRMQGTIHRELLKEYETELQTGTVLVLKQVSIISLSNRNHYLNITPNNIVALYYMRQNTLKSRMFHGSQDSLCSVLSALEKKADNLLNSLNSSLTVTPPGSLRQSSIGSSSSTPQLFRPSPKLHTPQGPAAGMAIQSARLGNDPSFIRGQNSTPVRDVSVTRIQNTTPMRNSSFNGGMTQQKPFNFHQNELGRNHNNTTGSSVNQHGNHNSKHNLSSLNLTNKSIVNAAHNKNFFNNQSAESTHFNNQSAGSTYRAEVVNPQTVDNNNVLRTPIIQQCINKPSAALTPNSDSRSKWKFKSPPSRSTSACSSPNITPNSTPNISNQKSNIQNSSYLRSISTVGITGNKQSLVNNTNTGGSTSTGNRNCQLTSGSVNNSIRIAAPIPGGQTRQTGTTCNNQIDTENLWEDDLSDEVLSQLSEDFS